MSADSDRTVRLRLLLPQSVRRLPADLTALVGVAIVASGVVLTPVLRRSALAFLAVAFVLFGPGYAVVAALFPQVSDGHDVRARDGDGSTESRATTSDQSRTRSHQSRAQRRGVIPQGGAIGWVERLALSVGVSIAALAFVGLAFEFAPWGIRVVPVVLALAVVTVGAAAVAGYRQWSLPAEERPDASIERWVSTARADLFDSDGRTETLLTAVLVVCLLVATASVVYAVAVPRDGQAFTEFYLLSENETGDLVAADYPATFDANRTNSLHVGLTNHEHRQMEYVVVAVVQRVAVTNGSGGGNESGVANDSLEVREQQELTRVRASVGANETWTREVNVTPALSASDGQDERLRLVLYLYRDGAPADASTETAYRQLRLVENATVTGNQTTESASSLASNYINSERDRAAPTVE